MAEQKRFYWLKLNRDFFKRHDIRIIEAMPDGRDYVLFYLKMMCESVDHDGSLRFNESIPYTEDMLATITNTNVAIVKAALDVFVKLHIMEIQEDGTYFMPKVSKMIGSAVDNDNANRQRRFREKNNKHPPRSNNKQRVGLHPEPRPMSPKAHQPFSLKEVLTGPGLALSFLI